MKKQIIALILFILVLSGCAGPAEESSSSRSFLTREHYGFDSIPDVDGYVCAPALVYTTTGEENGLTDTYMYADGKVRDIYKLGDYDVIDIETEDGTVAVMKSLYTSNWEHIALLDEVRVYFLYMGYSSELDSPAGTYIGVVKPGKYVSISSDIKAAPELFKTALDEYNTELEDEEASGSRPSTDGNSPPQAVVNSAPDAQSNTQSSSQQTSQAQTASTSQKKALDKANDYLRVMAFSHSGLVKQLEYEGYSNADATYAADNCGADWNAQALKKANSYLDVMAFSYSGLKGQLEYDGFTSSQSTYGADNCGANWNDQAAKKAKSYLDLMSFSRDELISQLEYEGFTRAQAEYGAAQNGY